jgi:hypothetical protein
LVGIKSPGVLAADGSKGDENEDVGHFLQFEAPPQHLLEVEPIVEGQPSQTSPPEEASPIA